MERLIIEDLNEQQRAAVQHTEGPVLVFAGAGSGKTRVLTYRIAYLMSVKGIRPWNILAVTFTNKAANEMKERIEALLGEEAKRLWAGTFHGICARILRERGAEIGIDPAFTIFDDSDQIALVRESMDNLALDQKRFQARDILSAISRAKEKLVLPEDYHRYFAGRIEAVAGEVYRVYQEKLAANHALDFDDLIMFTVFLIKNSPSAREHYQDRFRYILVDEYQDINYAQYVLVKMLSEKHRNIFCVGDDDQSIYRWRGADVGIILQFESDYPEATIYKLEQNYRSTKRILEAAYHVVKHNRGRADKKLWTANEEGAHIEIIRAANEIDEANSIARSIEDKVRFDGRKYSDFVILYRINAQSRVFEEALTNRRIPYRLIGSVRFYERKEIKDILAYLRLAANPYETVSLRRVINVPARGIGASSLEKLEKFAEREKIPLFDALRQIDDDSEIPKRTLNSMVAFAAMIEHLNQMAREVSVRRLTEEVMIVSGYVDALEKDHSMESQSRLENIRELLSVTEQFELTSDDRSLPAFLEQVALISDIDTYDDSSNAVTLMTVHSAKGLEFPVVYMVGMEEGLFPHRRAFEDREELEEERRLCYVGMTRARQELVLSYAYRRMFMGQTVHSEVSRFIEDIPEDLFAHSKLRQIAVEHDLKSSAGGSDSSWKAEIRLRQTGDTVTFKPGTKVRHPTFGCGIVLNSTGSGDDERVTVVFDEEGIKKLLVAYANLERI
jgi:DNA helicase-2/ATP-dependent DNA helicase PcrA